MEEQFKSEVMYESEGKTPLGESFITVKKARNYFEYTERGGKNSIAFILFNNKTKKFGLIKESKPPMDETLGKLAMMTTAFGGSIDSKHTYKEITQIEVREESGYDVLPDRIYEVGNTLVSSQMSQIMYGYLVDITDIDKSLVAEHETEDFKNNEVIWLDADELMENDCWKSIWIFTKSIHKDIIDLD